MVAALRDKAEKTWEGPDKAETLIRAAELEERFLHDAPAALRTAQEAVSAAAAEEDARVAEARARCLVARLLKAQGRHDESQSELETALARVPAEARDELLLLARREGLLA